MTDTAEHTPSAPSNNTQENSENAQWYRLLLESLEDAVFVHGITPDMKPGRFIEVNGAACRKLGYTREELLQMSVPDINPPGALKGMKERMKILREQDHILFEGNHITKDGRLIPVEIHTHLFRMEGQPVIISTARDISERIKWREQIKRDQQELEARVKERTEELRRSEERFRAIAHYTYDWENWISPEGELLWINPAVERITGYSAEEHLNHPDRIEMLVLEEDRDFMRELMQQSLREKTSDNDVPFRIRHKDGSIRWLSISYQPLYSPDGKYLGIRSSIRDISERVKMEQEREKLFSQLREAQKMEAIGTLAGGIAHDFNNILAAIIGYSEMAADEVPPGNDAARMINEVLKASTRAKDLISQILAFSRQGGGERKPVAIHLIVKEVVKLLQATIPKSINIQLKLCDSRVTILADPTQIHQVIMNLCTNAYHAMKEEGGTLTLAMDIVNPLPRDLAKGSVTPDSGEFFLLEVRDTGQGIPQTVLERIFDPYFTTKTQGEGTGLGLAVVHGIVKSHSGFLSVDSQPGKGTSFKVYFPCLETPEVSPARTIPATMKGGSEHILLVDDEDQLVNMWRRMLETLGYKVTATIDSREALNMFQEHPDQFDLVLSDMSMPHLSGTQLAKEILKLRSPMPMILCTGFSENINETTAKKMGFGTFLMKPVVMSELAATVRRVLDQD